MAGGTHSTDEDTEACLVLTERGFPCGSFLRLMKIPNSDKLVCLGRQPLRLHATPESMDGSH